MRRAFQLLSGSATILGWVLACADGGVVGGSCREGLIECAGQCVDPARDPAHCGSCGNVCAGGDICQAGSCGGDAGKPDSGDAGDANDDADSPFDVPPWDGPLHDVPDAGDGDGAAGTGGTGGDSGDDGGDGQAGAGGSDSGCTPPYDTPAHCGDCFTQCSGATPLCVPVDGGHACAPACPPPLTYCAGTCVDTQTDPDHCGQCGNECPSGICQAGKCVGATAGHVVLLCASFEQASQSSSITLLLGNAVFLPPQNPVRILGYVEHTPNAIQNKLGQVLGWSAQAKGRSYTLTPTTSPSAIPTQLKKADYDVLLVYDQPNAPAGALGSSGSSWAATVASFVGGGGVVVVASGGGGVGEVDELVTNAGLLSVSQQAAVPNGTVMANLAPFDAVGLNVLSPFVALKQSCTFSTSASPGPGTVFVVAPMSGDAGASAPMVVHRIP
ncbi:MAG: hypothetical protein U0263_05745 [Polyangiaceae bacterium]